MLDVQDQMAPGSHLAEALRNRLREARSGGTPIQALFLKLRDADAVAALALSGVEVVILDLEHSQLGPSQVGRICDLLTMYKIPCLVRVGEVNRGEVNRILEAGASGIQLSTTTSVDQVRNLVAASHYPPNGARSFSLAHRQGLYGVAGRAPYLKAASKGPVLVVQIETAVLQDPIEDIVKAGADMVFIGTEDLRLTCEALDCDAELKIQEVSSAARMGDVAWGCYASMTELQKRVLQGAAFLATGSDLGLLAQATRKHINETAQGISNSINRREGL